MSHSQNPNQASEMGAHALIESAQTLTNEAAKLLDLAVDLAENTRADKSLNSVVRAARNYVMQAADLTERAEVMTPCDSTEQRHQASRASKSPQGAPPERQLLQNAAKALELVESACTVGLEGATTLEHSQSLLGVLQNMADGLPVEVDNDMQAQLQALVYSLKTHGAAALRDIVTCFDKAAQAKHCLEAAVNAATPGQKGGQS